jgi:hypothetical protein
VITLPAADHLAYLEAGRLVDAATAAEARFWGVAPRADRSGSFLDDSALVEALDAAAASITPCTGDDPAAAVRALARQSVLAARERVASGGSWIRDARSVLIRAVLPGVLDRSAVSDEVALLEARAAGVHVGGPAAEVDALRRLVEDCARARPAIADDIGRLATIAAPRGSGPAPRDDSAGGTGRTGRTGRAGPTPADAPDDRDRDTRVLGWCRRELERAFAVLEDDADDALPELDGLARAHGPVEVRAIDAHVERAIGSPALALPYDGGGCVFMARSSHRDPAMRAHRLRHEGAPGHLTHFSLARGGPLHRYGMLFRDAAAREGWAVIAERGHAPADRAAAVEASRERVRRALHGVVGLLRRSSGAAAADAALDRIRSEHGPTLDAIGPGLARRVPLVYLRGAAAVAETVERGFDAWAAALTVGFVPMDVAADLVRADRPSTRIPELTP